MNLDNTVKRMDSVTDLAHAAYWLAIRSKATRNGWRFTAVSYGGFMVLASSPIIRAWAAGIDVVGIANFVTFMEKPAPTACPSRGGVRATYVSTASSSKDQPHSPCRQDQMSDDGDHGANDPRVPVEEAEQIVAHLRNEHPGGVSSIRRRRSRPSQAQNRLDAYPNGRVFG